MYSRCCSVIALAIIQNSTPCRIVGVSIAEAPTRQGMVKYMVNRNLDGRQSMRKNYQTKRILQQKIISKTKPKTCQISLPKILSRTDAHAHPQNWVPGVLAIICRSRLRLSRLFAVVCSFAPSMRIATALGVPQAITRPDRTEEPKEGATRQTGRTDILSPMNTTVNL